MIKIDNELIEKYVKQLGELNSIDKAINYKNVLAIFNNIEKGSLVEELFHSRMMFYTIFLLFRCLYLDGIISFGQNGTVCFKTNNCEIDQVEFNFPHLVDVSYEGKNIKLTREIIEGRDFDPMLEYYQSYDTFDTLKRRFKTMAHFDDIKDKSVIFLGDDELYSVFYALNSEAKRIVVVDIDERILDYIQKINKQYNLNIETYKYDLLEFFPDELCSQFDVFFASGLKDMGGILSFICTGLIALQERKKATGYFIYYEYNQTNSETSYEYQLQEYLIKMNCYIDCMIPSDEVQLPYSAIEKTIELIKWKQEEGLHENYLNEVKEKLKEGNPLSAEPAFPLFALEPIKLARISTTGVPTNLPNRLLKTVRNFKKKNQNF